MNWYQGNIAEAVNLSKSKNAIFVVYVDGTDEYSTRLRGFIDSEEVKSHLESEKFVGIKITSGSEAYMQFAQIYQVVPVPSLFFIGKNGLPLEIVTGVVKSADEVVTKINNALKQSGLSGINPINLTEPGLAPPQETSSLSATTSNRTAATVDFLSSERSGYSTADYECEDGVCQRKDEVEAKTEDVPEKSTEPKAEDEKISPVVVDEPKEEEKIEENKLEDKEEEKPKEPEKTQEEPTENEPRKAKKENQEKPKEPEKSQEEQTENEPQSDVDRADQLEKARKIIEEKRKEREAEEARIEREKEIQRRKQGQETQNLQRWQQEQELRELKETIRRERLEEQAAKQKILEKIASDRAERAQKFGVLNPTATPSAPQEQPANNSPPVQKSPQTDPGTSRIQFRKPDGESVTNSFKSSDKFSFVREYVKTTVLASSGIKEFSLATTFPRREFTLEDDKESLFELGLCPNAVLLILTASRQAAGPSAIVSGSGGFFRILSTIFYGLLSPFVAVYGYLTRFITGDDSGSTGAQKRASENTNDHDAAKRRNIERFGGKDSVNDGASTSFGAKRPDSTAYKRAGSSNVHRLHETKDSDDENNTWNGNSTQQQ